MEEEQSLQRFSCLLSDQTRNSSEDSPLNGPLQVAMKFPLHDFNINVGVLFTPLRQSNKMY